MYIEIYFIIFMTFNLLIFTTDSETPNRRGRPRKNSLVNQAPSLSLPLLSKIKG